jgi:hypothetical protein
MESDTRIRIFRENFVKRQEMLAAYKYNGGPKPFEFVRRPNDSSDIDPNHIYPRAAPIEFSAYPNHEHFGGRNCIGGGGSLERGLREDPLRHGSGDLLQRKSKDHARRQFVDFPGQVWLLGATVLLLAGVRDSRRQIVRVNNLSCPFDDDQFIHVLADQNAMRVQGEVLGFACSR